MIRLSDVFTPAVYGSYTALNNPETSAFVNAGIISTNSFLNAVAAQGSKSVTVPFWRDIDPNLEPNYSNDDPADLAVPNKIGTGTMTARNSWLNQSFGTMDLTIELSGQDPLQQVRNRFGTYWTRVLQRRVIAMCVGILADNVANDGGDMIVDISALTTNGGADAIFNKNTFVDAAFTMGDQAENLRAMAVHSQIMARMVKNDEIVYLDAPSQNGTRIPTYAGRTVVVDDSMPVSGSGANRIYTSMIFGGGAFGFGGVDGYAMALGVGTPENPAWVERNEQAGNGGGSETIGERKTWMIHPLGFEWVEPNAGTVGGALVEMSPTYADLRRAVVWNRIADRKNVPIAFIKSKG